MANVCVLVTVSEARVWRSVLTDRFTSQLDAVEACLQGFWPIKGGGSFMLFADADWSVTPESNTHLSRKNLVCIVVCDCSLICFSFNTFG